MSKSSNWIHLINKLSYKREIKCYEDNLIRICHILFNNCEFRILKIVVDCLDFDEEERSNIHRLIDFYMFRDCLDYNKVVFYEFRPFPYIFRQINNDYQRNVKGWNRLKRYDFEFILVIDLINKSRRLNMQKKFNEAILCIYRACELITHLQLWEQYRVNTDNLLVSRLSKLGLDDEFIREVSMDNKFHHSNLSLKKNFELLDALGDNIGRFYHINRFDFNDIIAIRHSSMLVHGINRITDIQFKKYDYLVTQLVGLFDRDALDLIALNEFPLFSVD